MTESLFDKYLDINTQTLLQRIAAAVFARHDVDFATARRAGGWTNAVWLAGGLVLRLAVQPGNDKIRREASLAALLPPEVRYPTIVESGEIEGHEWALTREIPGVTLSEAWTDLDSTARVDALRQFWQLASTVHTVPAAAVTGIARDRAWYNSNDAAYADAALTRFVEQNVLTATQAHSLRLALDCFWSALPAAEPVLNHGDLTFDNALYHHGEVVALLDFEYAVIAPVEMDLNSLVKFAYVPPEIEDPAGSGHEQLRAFVAECAAPILSRPESKDLLRGYGILLELWQLENWLTHPDGEGPLDTWEPYRRLLSLAREDSGYLAPLL